MLFYCHSSSHPQLNVRFILKWSTIWR